MVIGITGGVGCGKSTVLQILKEKYNAQIIEADKVGHIVMEKGNSAYQSILDLFGSEILSKDLEIDRVILGNIVFNNHELLNKLNSIIHPAVKEYIKELILNYSEKNLIIVEAALLIEAGYRDICDIYWYIYASKQTRINRLISSRGYSINKAESIMSNQLTDDEFRKNTDIIVNNDLSIEKLYHSVDEAIKLTYKSLKN
jgi:dephospho-CoA kinase